MSNIAYAQDNFAIWVSGTNLSNCTDAGGSYMVLFPAASALNQDAFRRAYSAAMMAYTLGKTVYVHNYVDGNCGGAQFIEVCDDAAGCA